MPEENATNQVAAEPAQTEDTFDYGETNTGVDAVTEESTTGETDATTTAADDATLGAPAEDDSEEIEYEGSKHKIPKVLKDAIMRHADYTKKTQEVAEHRKAVDAERESLANQAKAQQEYIQEYATLVANDQRIQQFAQVNWNQLNEQEPVTAQRLWIEYSQLKDAQNTITGKLQQKEQQRLRDEQNKASEAQQSTAKQLRECFEVVKRDIKDWSPELAKSLDKTANDFGFSNEELSKVTDPRFVKLLHKAHIAEQLLKKQAVVPPKPQAKPVPQVGAGSAPAGKRIEELGMADYIKARRAQLR